MRKASLLALALPLMQTGCMVVGYRSGSGWFFWPGGFALFVILFVILLIARRRR
jgi:hypothetical protein